MSFLLHDLRYFAWRIINPTKGYGVFYSKFIANNIRNGERHPTLSMAPKDQKNYDKNAEGWMTYLCQEFNLTSESKVVDYGCGGLRVGRYFIDFLNTGNYLGLDITDEFFRPAFDELDSKICAEKKPNVDTIHDASLLKAKNSNPNIVFSSGVLMHIPPSEVEQYLSNIVSIMRADTTALIAFRDGKHGQRLGIMRWAHDASILEKLPCLKDWKVEFRTDKISIAKDAGTSNKILVLSRKQIGNK